jgi:hypothetical protein
LVTGQMEATSSLCKRTRVHPLGAGKHSTYASGCCTLAPRTVSSPGRVGSVMRPRVGRCRAFRQDLVTGGDGRFRRRPLRWLHPH